MEDSRIIQYRQAAMDMAQGRFDGKIDTGDDDELGKLGEALAELGRAFQKKLEEMRTLSAVTEEVNAGVVLDDVLNHLYESFRPLIPYDRIGLALLEEDGSLAKLVWTRTDAPEVKIKVGFSAPMNGSSLRGVIETGQPRIINDLKAYARAYPESKSAQRIVDEGIRSDLTCPLIAQGKPIGFLFFSSKKPNSYQDVHISTFLQIAGQLALIIEKSHAYQEMSKLNELKNKFLGIAAHDLRSPLGVIKGSVDLICSGHLGEVPAEQRPLVESIRRACAGMFALINDLLDVSAIEAGELKLEKQVVELRAYLTECHATSSLLAKAKTIRVDLDMDAELPRVKIDPNRMCQVVGNLIANAIKFSWPDSRITIGAHVRDGDIQISVSDQGQGIPEEEIPLIFTDFGRTSIRPTAGEKTTGLGLAIARRIVEQHGGRIWVDSEVGKGSTFTVAIPLESETAKTP